MTSITVFIEEEEDVEFVEKDVTCSDILINFWSFISLLFQINYPYGIAFL